MKTQYVDDMRSVLMSFFLFLPVAETHCVLPSNFNVESFEAARLHLVHVTQHLPVRVPQVHRNVQLAAKVSRIHNLFKNKTGDLREYSLVIEVLFTLNCE